MLFYLDNYLSADPQRHAPAAAARCAPAARCGRFGRPFRRACRRNSKKKKNERGLNENYGRELMELHTLGVDGGYTPERRH